MSRLVSMLSLGLAAVTAALLAVITWSGAIDPAAHEPSPAAESAAVKDAVDKTGDSEPAGPAELPTPEVSRRGWKLFFSKKCIMCHSIRGQGGRKGPDLGIGAMGQLTEGALAAAMWTHVPRMWTKMEEEQIAFEPITRDEMADLFAFFFFLRYLGEPGDPQRGRLALERHGCQQCHGLSGEGGEVGPDLARWAQDTNPIVWTQMMWQAAPEMEAALKQRGMRWPVLEPGEMSDMVAYVRSVQPARQKSYLLQGSPLEGERLFGEKKCKSCHEGGAGSSAAPDLTAVQGSRNIAELAQQIANHLPSMLGEMRSRGIEVGDVTSQELAHIASYLLYTGYKDRPGDPEAGRRAFEELHCRGCHEQGTELAPALATMHADGSVAYLAQVMWNKGQSMRDEMAAQGIQWPIFTREQILDLLAYLRGATADGAAQPAAAAAPASEAGE